jgi:hypothetical protein
MKTYTQQEIDKILKNADKDALRILADLVFKNQKEYPNWVAIQSACIDKMKTI